jgi:hypothetical protein
LLKIAIWVAKAREKLWGFSLAQFYGWLPSPLLPKPLPTINTELFKLQFLGILRPESFFAARYPTPSGRGRKDKAGENRAISFAYFVFVRVLFRDQGWSGIQL